MALEKQHPADELKCVEVILFKAPQVSIAQKACFFACTFNWCLLDLCATAAIKKYSISFLFCMLYFFEFIFAAE